MFNPLGLAQNAEAAKDVSSLLGRGDMTMEMKLDGFRLLVHVDSGSVTPYTRTGKTQKGKLPHIEQALSSLPANTWLDGEIVAFDQAGLPEWGKVQTIMGSNITADQMTRASILTYVVFDMLAFDGTDIRSLPFSVRRSALETISHLFVGPHVLLSEQLEPTDANHELLVSQGYEGSIVKDKNAPYASGKRGRGWYKLKANDEADSIIMGSEPGKDSFAGMIGALVFGQWKLCDQCLGYYTSYPRGTRAMCSRCHRGMILTERGKCSGMTMKERIWFTSNIDELVANQAVISVAYMGIMPSGTLRHPQYKRLRQDKPSSDCVWI